MSNQITPNPERPTKNITPITFPQFAYTIGNLPTSYKDSMTYYETLVWFCRYLEETVIPAVNTNNDAVLELQELYGELNAYVTTYFDNLDVQEEINNKLDALVSDGTLLTLMASYIDPKLEDFREELSNVQDEVSAVTSGSPAGVYNTIAELQQADPDHSRIYVVLADGNWYYYNNSTNQWKNGGLYQSSVIKDINFYQLDNNLQNGFNGIIDYTKIFDKTTGTNETTVINGVFTTTLTNSQYGNGYNKINSDYYNYNGFEVTGIPNAPQLGLVIGYVNNDVNNFLFMIVTPSQTGSIYHIDNGTNLGKVGSFTNTNNVIGLKIKNLVNKILSFDIIKSNDTLSSTYDLTSIEETITPCIGFCSFSSEATTVSYKLNNFPYLSYAEFDERITELENKYDNVDSAIDYLQKEGINKNTNINIKMLGDSITAGFGGTGYNVEYQEGADLLFWGRYQNLSGTCWANSLKNYIESKYSNIHLTNYGVSGATSFNLVQYFETTNLVKPNDDIVIVMIGTNDRNNSKSSLYNNLKSLYTKIKAMNKKVIFMGSIPASIENEEEHTLHMEDINMIIEGFCKEYNIDFISVYKLFTEYCINTGITIDSLLSDGLHPNDEGYKVMFEIISNHLGFYTKRNGATW